MSATPPTNENLRQVVPFLGVTDMERSIRFYIDGLGFTMKYDWVRDGKLRWCWLTRGGASLMLQEFAREGNGCLRPEGKLGQGISRCFQCQEAIALYPEFHSHGIDAKAPKSRLSATRCGLQSSARPTATGSTSKASPTWRKKRNCRKWRSDFFAQGSRLE